VASRLLVELYANGAKRKVVAVSKEVGGPKSRGLSVLRRPAYGLSVSNERPRVRPAFDRFGRKVFAGPAQLRSAESQVGSGASFARAAGVAAPVHGALSESGLCAGSRWASAMKGWRQVGRSKTMLLEGISSRRRRPNLEYKLKGEALSAMRAATSFTKRSEEAVRRARPNPSIEGTASGLRPPAAPHVKR
jgi:hypothetical protein